jgi:glutamate dehydrogenase (NADP+)
VSWVHELAVPPEPPGDVDKLGGTVLTLSDSNGSIHDEQGLDERKLAFVMDLKNNRRARIAEYRERYPDAHYLEGERPWSVPCDIALPCATENELNAEDAATLLENGCFCVAEGANMPCDPDAVEKLHDAGILFAPGKASNAGGVAVSGLEMTQNAQRLAWTRKEVDKRLHLIMSEIHHLREVRPQGRLHQLRRRRQRRRLHQGRRRDARPGSGVGPLLICARHSWWWNPS